MQRDPGSPSRRCPGIMLSGSTGVRSVETLRTSGECSESTRGIPVGTAPAWCPISSQALGHPCPRAPECLAIPSSQSSSEKRAAPENWQLAAAKLRREGYVTFHRGHCGCQEEQQQAIQGHRRPASPRRSPSRDAPRPGAPLRSRRVASPCPFSLWPGPDSPERGVGVGGSVRAWGGAGARGCGCACVCVCLWERWVCACVCERG